jgi:hypothetical protein
MDKNSVHTIEDLLELLAGHRQGSKIQIESSDATIMYSIARQVFKGLALTDRQFELMKQKLLFYRNQFTALGYDFDQAVETLRQPLREIDRTKSITFSDLPEDVRTENTNETYIKVRFPFKKSLIMLIEEAKPSDGYHHDKGTHEHYFTFNEINVLKLLDRFIDKDFVIDAELIEVYQRIKEIADSPQKHLSGIVNNKLVNIDPKLEPILHKELGVLSDENRLKYIDRRFRYAFDLYDIPEPKSLIENIAYRKKRSYQSIPSKESMPSFLDALWNLERFPILVVLERKNAEQQLHECITFFRDILSYDEQSVLFRNDGQDDGFNNLIKDRKLNNWVDKNTKIVYISIDKLPKVLLKTDWKPTAALLYNSMIDRAVDAYTGSNCDLIIYREETISPFRRHSTQYGIL